MQHGVQIKVLRILIGLCARITDVALRVQAFRKLHSLIRPDAQAGAADSHQFDRVEGLRFALERLLAADTLHTAKEDGKRKGNGNEH